MVLGPLRAAVRNVRSYVTQVMSVEESIRHKLTGAFEPTHLYIRNEYVHPGTNTAARRNMHIMLLW